jgi:hypothetical protein
VARPCERVGRAPSRNDPKVLRFFDIGQVCAPGLVTFNEDGEAVDEDEEALLLGFKVIGVITGLVAPDWVTLICAMEGLSVGCAVCVVGVTGVSGAAVAAGTDTGDWPCPGVEGAI